MLAVAGNKSSAKGFVDTTSKKGQEQAEEFLNKQAANAKRQPGKATTSGMLEDDDEEKPKKGGKPKAKAICAGIGGLHGDCRS